MSAFNFKKEFAPDVEAGRKCQTIRAERKNKKPPCKLGGNLQLYTGMRTKACRKLVDPDPVCTFLTRIKLEMKKRGDDTAGPVIYIDGWTLTPANARAVALADGFASVAKMVDFFEEEHGLPFEGWLIKWTPK